MDGETPLEDSAKRFEYRASLSEKALPEMLSAIDRFRVPGVIEVSRAEVVKRIYLREGSVLHASSSDLRDSLGAFLLRCGKLTEEQYNATNDLLSEQDKRYGVLLVEQGLLSPSEIYHAIRKQIEEIVWSLFYWQDGEVTFSIGDFEASQRVHIQLPMRQVILNGIKRAPNAKALVARLGRKETVFEPCYQTEEVIEAALESADQRLLSLVDGRRTLYEICTHGPYSAAENAKLMYAFHVLQLVRLGTEGPPPTPKDAAEEPESRGIKIRLKTPGGAFGE